MKQNRLVPYFGSGSEQAEAVAHLLAGRSWVGVPFCGGMSDVRLVKCSTLVVNDLHAHVINLAMILRDPYYKARLVADLENRAFHPMELAQAQIDAAAYDHEVDGLMRVDMAAAYFVSQWMGRSGDAGTEREFSGKLSTRTNANGGDSCKRFRSAVDSLEDWAAFMRRCNFSVASFREWFDCYCGDTEQHGYYCLPSYARVRMYDESVRPISEVCVGDFVAPGRCVKRVMTRHHRGPMVRLWITGMAEPLELTREHVVSCSPFRVTNHHRDRRTADEVFAERRDVAACELKKGDYLFTPANGMESPVNWRWADVKLRADERPTSFTDGPELWRLLGYYAAEGHLQWPRDRQHPQAAVLNFGDHEHCGVAADAARCCRAAFGFNPTVTRHSPHPTAMLVRMGRSRVACLIHRFIPGNDATVKQLSGELMTGPVELQRELLAGWLAGDGGLYVGKGNKPRYTGTSASETLAEQMFRIAQRCGLTPAIKQRGRSYDVQFSLRDVERLGHTTAGVSRAGRKCHDGMIASRIRKIEEYDFDGMVYDLDVDGDSYFVCGGVLVHNCDPPWVEEGLRYLFPFTEQDHRDLAARLRQFTKARVVLRYGDHPLIRELYDGWTFSVRPTRNQSNNAVQEVLIDNGTLTV